MGGTIDNIRYNFLHIDTYSFGKNWVFPETSISYNMLRYIESGTGAFFLDGIEYVVEKGQVVYIPRDSRLSSYSLSDNFSFTSIRFTTSVYFEGGNILQDCYHIPTLSQGDAEKQFFDLIHTWFKRDHPARMFFVRGYLEVLIGTLIEKVSQSGEIVSLETEAIDQYNLESIRNRMNAINGHGHFIDSRIQVVIDYILLHPNERYTPAKMAEMAELSTQRFGSLFKEQTGKTPMVYVKDLKLSTAARKLLTSNDNISKISYETGYEDPNYFTREFKAAFGYTPKQYRQLAKE